jgi:uncharacterized protein YeaC (DUF1315 family)
LLKNEKVKNMTVDELIKAMTPEIFQNMKTSLELSRWPDGRKMDSEQKVLCMEALIRYEEMTNMPADQRIGYMEASCKSSKDDDTQTLTIQ